MPDYSGDQASGLRRLFGHKRLRSVSFAAGSAGVGKSQLVANLAVALAESGLEVLVLDETERRNVASCFGLIAPCDLRSVIDGERALAEALLRVAPGIAILKLSKLVKKLPDLKPEESSCLRECLVEAGASADVVLVDTSSEHPLGFSPLGLAAQDSVVVVSGTGASITESYALIKKVSLGYARTNYRVLISRVRSQEEARAIHGNISRLAGSRGFARIGFAGHVPQDELLRQASALSQPVLTLYPDSPAAKAYRSIAGELLSWPLSGEGAVGIEQFVQQLLDTSRYIDPIAIYA